MPLTPQYVYIGAAPTKVTNAVSTELTRDVSKKDTNVYNPIFNFDQTFVDKLQGVNAVDMAQSVPYVSIRTRNSSGELLEDLNMSFFHRQADFDNFNRDVRYPERPIMSLKSLELKTTNASGWLYYTEVSLAIKIHSPDALKRTTLIALVTPEMPLELEYGWNSPDPFLGDENKERLLFQVSSYNISFDETGQIDLKVDGLAYGERMSNTYLGDVGQDFSDDTLTDGKQFDSISSLVTKIKAELDNLKELSANPESGPNNTDIIKSRAENYQSIEKSARETLSAEYTKAFKKLRALAAEKTIGKRKKKFGYVTFHDAIYTMCNDSFKAMSELFIGAEEFKVIYGNFNERAGKLGGTSIADFEINFKKLDNALKTARSKGKFVLTIGDFINLLIGKFLENEEYLKTQISSKEKESYVKPNIEFNFSNRAGIIELQVIDVRSDVPTTTGDLMKQGGKMAPAAIEKAAIENNLAIIKLGHANSFIKKIDLQQVTDSGMKSALIARMSQDRVESARSNIAPGNSPEEEPAEPLQLPLRGIAHVVGHTQWKPFRAFYLSTGFFLIDGVYKITGVSHSLSAGNYSTRIDFIYH